MLLFEIANNEVDYLNEILDNFPENILMTKSKNFSGNTEIIDVVILLTPTILSTLAVCLNNILQHKVSLKEANKNQPTEVALKMKNKNNDYEIILKSSTISNEDELEKAINIAINKIKDMKDYE